MRRMYQVAVERIVIAGAGLAGVRTAEELRRAGYEGEIVLLDDEGHLPYDRPPLSKDVIRGEREDTTLRPAEFFDEQRIDLRLGARVGWRRLTELADPLALSPQYLYDLGEAIFVYLDQLANAAAEGYEEARAHAAGEMERRRRRLLDLLLSRPPAGAEAIADLARAAGWRLPRTVAGVALDEVAARGPAMPPDVLTGYDRDAPCLLVPDPAGPGQERMLDLALRGRRAAVGPAVPLDAAATSLCWAVEALELSRRGVLPRGLLRCADHMSTLIVFKDERLVDALARERLAPLAHLRPSQQDRLAGPQVCQRRGRGAGEVAARLHVHPQTVRYRLRQLEELYGDQLADPDVRFELEIVLRARQAALSAEPS